MRGSDSARQADRLDALLRSLAVVVEGLDEPDREELLRLVCTRPLDHTPFPELLLDAVDEVSNEGEDVPRVRLMATGCTAEGDPEPLGTVVGTSADVRAWASFLLDLRSRGFSGVRVVFSPAGEEVAEAVSTVFPEARFEAVPEEFSPPWLTLSRPDEKPFGHGAPALPAGEPRSAESEENA